MPGSAGTPAGVAAIGFVPKRGRPSPVQAAAIDRAILSAARRVFLDQGYDALAMDALAARIGVSKGTIYARHPSKEALLSAVLHDIIEDWVAAAAVDETVLTDDIAIRLRYHARRIARSLLNPDVYAVHRLMMTTRHRFPDTWKMLFDIGYLRTVTGLAQEITAAAARDGIPVRDAGGCARALFSMISGWHMQESGLRALTVVDVEAFADRAAELILAARSAW